MIDESESGTQHSALITHHFDVLDLLSRLVDKSLVVADAAGTEPRFRMLEVIRQYARERLREYGGEAAALAAHLGYFVAFADGAFADYGGATHERWRERVAGETANFRAALGHATGDPEKAETALRLCIALGAFWDMYGLWSEGRAWLGQVLPSAAGAPTETRGKALMRAGSLALRQCDFDGARALLEESRAALREAGNAHGYATALSQLGLVEAGSGEYERAAALLEEALVEFRAEGHAASVAATLHQLGTMAVERQDLERAEACLEESLALFRAADFTQGVGMVLCEAAVAAQLRGDLDRAETLGHESVNVLRSGGFAPLAARSECVLGGIMLERGRVEEAFEKFAAALVRERDLGALGEVARAVEGLACVAGARGQARRAGTLAGAAVALREAIRDPIAPNDRAALERWTAEALGGEAGARYLAEGRAMPLDDAVAYALSRG